MAFSPFRRQKPAMYDYTSSLDQRNEDLLERERRRISYEKYLEFLRLGQSGHDNIQRARQEMESQGLFKSPEERRNVPIQGPPERGHRYTGPFISKVDQPFPIGNVPYVKPAREDTEEEKQLKSYAAARDVDPEAADAAVRLPKHLTNSSVRSYLNFLDEQRQDAIKSGNQERVDQLTKKMVEYNPTEGIDTTLVEGPRLDAIVASRAQRLEHEGRQLRSKAVARAREAERKDMEVSKARRDIRTDDNLRDLMISMQKHNDEGMAVEIHHGRASYDSPYEEGVNHQKTFDDIKEIYGKHWTPSHTEEWDKWVEETFAAKRAHREVAKHPKASQRAAEEVREKNRRINQERMASGKPQLPEVSLTEMAEKLRADPEGLERRAEGVEQTITEFNRPYPELGESEVEYTGGGTVHVGSPDTSDRKQWDRERGTNIIALAIRADGLINKKDILGESVLDRATKHQQDQLFLDVGGSLISDPEKKTWPLPRTPEQRLAAIQHDPNVRESVLVDFLMRSNPSISELDARKYAQIAIKHADEKQAIIEKLGSPNAPDTLLGKLHKAQKEYTRKGDELVQPDIKLVGGMFSSVTTRKEATALGLRDKWKDEAREKADRLTELSRKAGDAEGYAAAEKAIRDIESTLLYENLREKAIHAQAQVYDENAPIPTKTVDGKTVAVEWSPEQQFGLIKFTGDPTADAQLAQAVIRNLQGAVNAQGLTVEGFGTDYARYVADAPWIPIYHHLMSGGLSAIAYSALDEKTARTAMNDALTMPLSAALNVATAGWQAASFVDPSGFSLGVRDKMTRLTNAISEGSQINQQRQYPEGVARWATPVWSGGVSAAQMGIYTAAGVPWYGVTSSYFLQSFAQSHLEGLDKGLSDREAVNYGIVMGLGESLPEIAGSLMYKKFGFGAGLMKYVMSPKGVLKPAVHQGMAKGFAQGLGWVAKEIGVTIPSEQAQELTTMLIQAWARHQWNIDPNALDAESLARNAIDTVVSTFVATGATSGTIGSIQYKKAYATQKRNLHEILQHEDFSRISEMTKNQFEEYAKEVFNRRVAENPETKWGELKRFLDRVHQYATQPSLFDGGVGDGFIEAFVEMFPGQTQLIVDGGTSRNDFKKAFMGTLPKGLDTAAAREKFKERAEGELRRREEKITVAQQKSDPGPPKITTWHVPVQMPTSFDEQGEPVYERTFITVKADSMEEASERVANDPRFEGTVVSRQAEEAYTPAEEQQTLFEVEPDYSATEIEEAEEGQPVEPPLPVSIRDDLEEMNPSELDAIAKDLGLKLGGKSSAAKINAILEAQAPTEAAEGAITAYHATDVEFEAFGSGVYYFAATPELAANAAIKTGKQPVVTKKVQIPSNLLRIRGEPNSFAFWRVLDHMLEDGHITEEQHGRYMDRYDAIEEESALELDTDEIVAPLWKDLAKELGVNGFKFYNEFDAGINIEGTGQDVDAADSYIIPFPDRITITPTPTEAAPQTPAEEAQQRVDEAKQELKDALADVVRNPKLLSGSPITEQEIRAAKAVFNYLYEKAKQLGISAKEAAKHLYKEYNLKPGENKAVDERISEQVSKVDDQLGEDVERAEEEGSIKAAVAEQEAEIQRLKSTPDDDISSRDNLRDRVHDWIVHTSRATNQPVSLIKRGIFKSLGITRADPAYKSLKESMEDIALDAALFLAENPEAGTPVEEIAAKLEHRADKLSARLMAKGSPRRTGALILALNLYEGDKMTRGKWAALMKEHFPSLPASELKALYKQARIDKDYIASDSKEAQFNKKLKSTSRGSKAEITAMADLKRQIRLEVKASKEGKRAGLIEGRRKTTEFYQKKIDDLKKKTADKAKLTKELRKEFDRILRAMGATDPKFLGSLTKDLRQVNLKLKKIDGVWALAADPARGLPRVPVIPKVGPYKIKLKDGSTIVIKEPTMKPDDPRLRQTLGFIEALIDVSERFTAYKTDLAHKSLRATITRATSKGLIPEYDKFMVDLLKSAGLAEAVAGKPKMTAEDIEKKQREIEGRFKAVERRFDELGLPAPDAAETVAQLSKLQGLGIESLTEEEALGLRDSLAQLMHNSRYKNRLQRKGEKAVFGKDRDTVLSEVELEELSVSGTRLTVDAKGKRRYGKLLNTLFLNPLTMAEVHSGGLDTTFSKYFYNDLNDGQDGAFADHMEDYDFMYDAFVAVGLDPDTKEGALAIRRLSWDFSDSERAVVAVAKKLLGKKHADKKYRDLWRRSERTVVEPHKVKLKSGTTIALSPAQRITLLMHLQDIETHNLIHGGTPIALSRSAKDAHKLQPDDIKAIVNLYGGKRDVELELANAMLNRINGSMRQSMQEYFIATHGFDLTKEGTYFPRMRMNESASMRDAKIEDFYQRHYTSNIDNLSITKRRTEDKESPIVVPDAFSAFMNHSRMVAGLRNMAIPMRNLNRLLHDRKLRKAWGDTKDGDALIKYYKRLLDALAKEQVGMSTRGTSFSVDTIARQSFLNAATLAGLWGNPKTGLYQFASVLTAMSQIPSHHVPTNTHALFEPLNPLSKSIDEEMALHSPYLRARATGGGQSFVTEGLGGRSQKHPYLKSQSAGNRDIRDTGMGMIKAMDAGAIRVIWAASKSWVKSEKKFKEGSKEYWAEVTRRAGEVVKRSQPTQDSLHLSGMALEARQGSALAKLGVMFGSQRSKNTNMQVQAYLMFKKARALAREGKGAEATRLAWQATRGSLLHSVAQPMSIISTNAMWHSITGVVAWKGYEALFGAAAPPDEEEAESWTSFFIRGIMANNIGNLPFSATLVWGAEELLYRVGLTEKKPYDPSPVPLTGMYDQLIQGIGRTLNILTDEELDMLEKVSTTALQAVSTLPGPGAVPRPFMKALLKRGNPEGVGSWEKKLNSEMQDYRAEVEKIRERIGGKKRVMGEAWHVKPENRAKLLAFKRFTEEVIGPHTSRKKGTEDNSAIGNLNRLRKKRKELKEERETAPEENKEKLTKKIIELSRDIDTGSIAVLRFIENWEAKVDVKAKDIESWPQYSKWERYYQKWQARR